MILLSHSIIGVAAASVFPSNPMLAFSVALASHYIMDAIPHWDYKLLSSKEDSKTPLNNDIVIGENFIFDLRNVFIDALLGVIISFLLFYFFGFGHSVLILIVGIIGGIIPDILQFVYFKIRKEPFKSLYIFHNFIHSCHKELKRHNVAGIFFQIATVASVVLLIEFFLIN